MVIYGSPISCCLLSGSAGVDFNNMTGYLHVQVLLNLENLLEIIETKQELIIEFFCCTMLFGIYLQLQITAYVILEVLELDLLLSLSF